LHYKLIHWCASSISLNTVCTAVTGESYEIQHSLMALHDDVHHMRRRFSGFLSVVDLSLGGTGSWNNSRYL